MIKLFVGLALSGHLLVGLVHRLRDNRVLWCCVDYGWVLVALVALFGATRQIEQQQHMEATRVALAEIRLRRQVLTETAEREGLFLSVPPSYMSKSSDLRAAGRWFDDVARRLRSDDWGVAVQSFLQLSIPEEEEIAGMVADFVRDLRDLVTLQEKLDATVVGARSGRFDRFLLTVWPLLLSFALAVRLTKGFADILNARRAAAVGGQR